LIKDSQSRINVKFAIFGGVFLKNLLKQTGMRLFVATASQDDPLKILYLDTGLLLGFDVISRFLYVSTDFVIVF
jgi:hypothetical protein